MFGRKLPDLELVVLGAVLGHPFLHQVRQPLRLETRARSPIDPSRVLRSTLRFVRGTEGELLRTLAQTETARRIESFHWEPWDLEARLAGLEERRAAAAAARDDPDLRARIATLDRLLKKARRDARGRATVLRLARASFLEETAGAPPVRGERHFEYEGVLPVRARTTIAGGSPAQALVRRWSYDAAARPIRFAGGNESARLHWEDDRLARVEHTLASDGFRCSSLTEYLAAPRAAQGAPRGALASATDQSTTERPGAPPAHSRATARYLYD